MLKRFWNWLKSFFNTKEMVEAILATNLPDLCPRCNRELIQSMRTPTRYCRRCVIHLAVPRELGLEKDYLNRMTPALLAKSSFERDDALTAAHAGRLSSDALQRRLQFIEDRLLSHRESLDSVEKKIKEAIDAYSDV
jgi:hypothetical protein